MTEPSLIFHDNEERAGTHVLLIGIGDYPWLEGGSEFKSDTHEDNAKGMGQLPSPPLSMRKLADWFFDEFTNSDRPLASMSLVLSEKTDKPPYSHPKTGGKTAPQQSGAIGDIVDAVDAWIERSSARRDNNIVLGFCGHGIQSGDALLLCRDYGKNVQSPFRGAINFEQFRIALSTKQPDQQLMLIDACRNPDLEVSLIGQDPPGNRLLDLGSLTNRNNAPALQSVHFATSLFSKAWGRKTGVSLFTEAVLKALSGGAAEHSAGWWVTTGRLHSVLSTYLRRISAKEKVVQIPAAHTQDFPISKPSSVWVDLYIDSSEASIWRERLKIFAKRGETVANSLDHNPDKPGLPPLEMSVTLPMSAPPRRSDFAYDIHAEFEPESEYGNCIEEIIAYPPEVDCSLLVSKKP